VCDLGIEQRYYVHYKGWNSRYDEWINRRRIAYKYKGPLADNDADSSKSEVSLNLDIFLFIIFNYNLNFITSFYLYFYL